MKKTILLITLCILAFLFTACSKDEDSAQEAKAPIVIGFSQVGAESDWRNANTQSMISAFSEENGYRLILDDAQNKQEKQITALRNFIQMGVDYIVLAPTTETGWDTVLGEAKQAGIPVIIVDRSITADKSLYSCWVGSDFKKESRVAVAWMEENLSQTEPVRILHLQGNLGSSAQLGRTAGLDEALAAHPDWQLVYRASGDFTQAKGQQITEALLRRGVRFNVVYSENDNMAFGAIDALKAAGLEPGKDVVIVSFDAGRRALELTMKGEISFDVECNPLHGPRVAGIIQRLESGISPVKLTFVEESSFDSSITQEILDLREY